MIYRCITSSSVHPSPLAGLRLRHLLTALSTFSSLHWFIITSPIHRDWPVLKTVGAFTAWTIILPRPFHDTPISTGTIDMASCGLVKEPWLISVGPCRIRVLHCYTSLGWRWWWINLVDYIIDGTDDLSSILVPSHTIFAPHWGLDNLLPFLPIHCQYPKLLIIIRLDPQRLKSEKPNKHLL